MLALLAAMVASPTDSPAPLESTTKWSIDYADDQCFLSRTFGVGPGQIILGFGMLPGAVNDQIFLIESGRDAGGTRRVSAVFDLGSGLEPVEAGGLGIARKEGGRITRLGAPAAAVERFRGAEQVAISADGQRYQLRLSGMKAAFAAADACKSDLMRDWGLDPKLVTEVKTPAQPVRDPVTWVSPDDYPRESRIAGDRGQAVARLDIDAVGVVTGCSIVQSSGADLLDNVTCTVLRKRARFHPARDAADKPVPTIWIQRFRWQS